MATDELSCKELVELVTAYFDNALSDADRQQFEAHLQCCDGCRTYLAQMRQTVALVGTLTEESVDPHTKPELLRLFRAWKQR